MSVERDGEVSDVGLLDVLNINFSVLVNMYKLNVTSYWYRLR